MAIDTHLSKWGNSLAIRIPQEVVKGARLAEGDRLSLEVNNDGSIMLRSARRKYDLKQLTSRITPKNRHAETDWGRPAGGESW